METKSHLSHDNESNKDDASSIILVEDLDYGSSSSESGDYELYDHEIPKAPSYLGTLLEINSSDLDDDSNLLVDSDSRGRSNNGLQNDDIESSSDFEMKSLNRHRLNSSCRYTKSSSSSFRVSPGGGRPRFDRIQGTRSFQPSLDDLHDNDDEKDEEEKSMGGPRSPMEEFLKAYESHPYDQTANLIIASTGNGMSTEDYERYLTVLNNSVTTSPTQSCRVLLWQSIKTNDVSLADTLLRDFGIEYILRHCGVMPCPELLVQEEEEGETTDGDTTDVSVSGMEENDAIHQKIINNKNNSEKKRHMEKQERDSTGGDGGGAIAEAHIFWLAAFYGSDQVLDILAQDTLALFVETDKPPPPSSFYTDEGNDDDNDSENYQTSNLDPTTLTQTPSQEVEAHLNTTLARAKKRLQTLMNQPHITAKSKKAPIYIASERNHPSVLPILLQNGADPNVTNHRGNTPALIAATLDHVEVLKVLVEQSEDVDLNLKNEVGMNPILAASQCGNLDCIRVLMNSTISCYNGHCSNNSEERVDFKVRDKDGFGCTALAARYHRHEVVEYFCQHYNPHSKSANGLDINQRDPRERETALHIAARCNSAMVVRALLQSYGISDSGGNRQLSACSSITSQSSLSNQQHQAATAVQPHCADPTLKNKHDMTALHIAVRHNFHQVIREIIDALSFEELAQLDTMDKSGRTPLFYAVSNGYLDSVKLLAPVSNMSTMCRLHYRIDKGTSFSSKVFKYQPALAVAASSGNCEILQILLHCGSNVNDMDDLGHTAVSLASRFGHLEAVKMLVEHGADLKIRSKKGSRTPLQKAKKYKHNDVVAFLEAQLHHGGIIGGGR